MGIVEENIFQDWTEGTQDISVSLEWFLIITDQCYIIETNFYEQHIKYSWGNINGELFQLQSTDYVFVLSLLCEE